MPVHCSIVLPKIFFLPYILRLASGWCLLLKLMFSWFCACSVPVQYDNLWSIFVTLIFCSTFDRNGHWIRRVSCLCLRVKLWLHMVLFCLLMAIILCCCTASSLQMLVDASYVASSFTWSDNVARNLICLCFWFCFLFAVHNIAEFPKFSYLLLVIRGHTSFAEVGFPVKAYCPLHYSWLWRLICMFTETRRRLRPGTAYSSLHFRDLVLGTPQCPSPKRLWQ